MKNNIRVADKFRNMVTGEEVVVTEINDAEVTFDNGKTFAKEQVQTCFQFEGNDTLAPIPAVEVVDGSLFVDGEKIETGIMKPETVLACVPGAALIVTSAVGEKKNLVRFDVEEKRFNELISGVDNAEKLYEDGQILIYKTFTTTDRSVAAEKEGDEPVIIKDYTDHVYVLRDGEKVASCGDMMLSKNLASIVADDGAKLLFFAREQKLAYQEDISGDGVQYLEPLDGVDLVEFVITESVNEDGGKVYTYVDDYSDHYGSVASVNQVHGDTRGALIVTGSGIHIFGRRHMAIGKDVLDAVQKCPILVRFTPYSHDHDHDTFVLANDNYEVITIRVKRVGGPVGYVTTVE